MKTFKLLTLGIAQDEEVIDYPLHDGIIINQENSQRSWVLEMLMDVSHKADFDRLMDSGKVHDVKVVISYPENEPATFEVTIQGVKIIGDHISVLMKGNLKRARRKYAETLLSELLEDGLEGDQLLERFESDMRERPTLRKDEANT